MTTEDAGRKNYGDGMASEDAEKQFADSPPAKEDPPSPPFSFVHEIAFVIVLCSSQLSMLAGLGNTIAPLHIIGDSFGTTSPGRLSWYVAAYSLTVGTFILIAGRLGDILGHKLLFILGYLWFGLWSLITGLSVYSHSQVFYDVCRAMQGIGPAMLLPNALAIMGRTYPQGRRKEMVFSLFGATAPWGFVIGAGFGSTLAERAWWPWAYWCLAIACCLWGGAAFFIIPSRDNDVVTDKSFDYLGSATGVAGLVLLNVAWNVSIISSLFRSHSYSALSLRYVSRVSAPLLPLIVVL